MSVTSSPSITAYRIGDGRYPLFDGRGAMLEGGCWNSPGAPVVYGGLSQAGAMLEVLAHAGIGRLPRHTQMIVIEIPGSLKVETVDPVTLPGWDHLNNQVSRAYGDEWLSSQRSVALIVPSVIAPHDKNIVINQMHPDFPRIGSRPPESIRWDQRLFSHKAKGTIKVKRPV